MAPYATTGLHTHGSFAAGAQTRAQLPYSPQECPPPCPACGGLQCLCRPRFFAGQLLTDEDLTRLEHYIVEKNKLHNRYLHGYGIVCGLDVVCHPCDDKKIVVKPGYALSPCGEDIIVCDDHAVPLCELIDECRPATPQCDPLRPASADTCPEGEQEWVLAICYDEKTARGISALRADPAPGCCASCACGGSAACGCGCHPAGGNGQTPKTSPATHGRRRPVPCEPTLTCETYKFIVYRYQEKPRDAIKWPAGKITDREFTGSLVRLSEQLGQAPAESAELGEWQRYGNNYRDLISDFLARTECFSYEDKRRLDTMSAPDPAVFTGNRTAYVAEIKNYVGNVSVYLIWYLLLALCKFLKPSCPEPQERNCIALARIRVRKPDCRVLSICEISVREYVLSALLERFYALIRSQLAEVLGRLCCDRRRAVADDVLGRRIGEKISVFDNEARLQALAALKGQGAQAPGPGTFLERSVGNRERGADMETLVLGLLGAKDSSGKTFALAEELADPVSFMLSHQVWRPFIDAVLPESWNGALQLISKVGGREIASLATQVPATGLTKEVTDLRQTVAGLEKITSDQQKVIAELQRRIGRR